jgi:L-malate glycosyltransferase
MNILILFSHRWRGGRAGGAETYTLELIKGLAQRGHSLTLATNTADPDCPGQPATDLAAHYQLPFHSVSPLAIFSIYRRLRRIASERNIEIVHAQHRTAAYFAELLCGKLRVPYVVTIHGPRHRIPFKRLHGRVFRHVIAVSDSLREMLIREFHLPPERVRTIHNGVDPKRFSEVSPEQARDFRASYGIGPDEIVLSQISRISHAKGQHNLIEALATLPRTLNYRCLIFGEGDERPRLEQLVIRRGLEHKVLFCGFRGDIPVVLAGSDVMVLPSHREGLPLAIVEAMLSRVAVIAANTGGVPEIITHGKDGLLFEAGDVTTLAGYIEQLVTDAERRQRLAEAGRDTALARFLISRVVDETHAYYREITAQEAEGDPPRRT